MALQQGDGMHWPAVSFGYCAEWIMHARVGLLPPLYPAHIYYPAMLGEAVDVILRCLVMGTTRVLHLPLESHPCCALMINGRPAFVLFNGATISTGDVRSSANR